MKAIMPYLSSRRTEYHAKPRMMSANGAATTVSQYSALCPEQG